MPTFEPFKSTSHSLHSSTKDLPNTKPQHLDIPVNCMMSFIFISSPLYNTDLYCIVIHVHPDLLASIWGHGTKVQLCETHLRAQAFLLQRAQIDFFQTLKCDLSVSRLKPELTQDGCEGHWLPLSCSLVHASVSSQQSRDDKWCFFYLEALYIFCQFEWCRVVALWSQYYRVGNDRRWLYYIILCEVDCIM